jgi:methyl-accepting chemotaxis protein
MRLITNMSTQIDPLALKTATSAARAGETSGFVVIAGEVTMLAPQTGKASSGTEEQIAAVRAVADHAIGRGSGQDRCNHRP